MTKATMGNKITDINVKASRFGLRCMICEAPLGEYEEAVCRNCVLGGPREAARRARENAKEFKSIAKLIETVAAFLEGLSQSEYLKLIKREKLKRACLSDKMARA